MILTIMRDHATRVEKRLPYLIKTYPHLVKNVHGFCSKVQDKEMVAEFILEELNKSTTIAEYQLFWFATMLEDYLINTSKASVIISKLFNHRRATSISKAKILEIPDVRFGLPELRNDFLKSGRSDWLAWSSAVGSRSLQAITRNHSLKYFGSSSQINHLIATIMFKR